ncbi:hypothetical protein JBP901_gp098 [Bacillus phage JBP901]|uniref:Uncharacterized protein n=2 Tax=Caeruleovirus TaxID=1911929 RepID=A0A0E3DEL9_9CAUD|nr:hypothetical protein JBP901_gp098 [Bacillus phage JBP901]YP_009149699.1 hypothetical protein BCP8-2_138 [Bacillus phage BCP8-2]AHJ87176.1 hypothetical protein BCP8-2_138 [Bacillus phage BCP8-2]AID17810.1 hypothetical protein JBP901_gp098 [Bacillus phage JBP901]
MDEKVEQLVDYGIETLFNFIESHNIDPDSIYVISMEESFKDNDAVEVTKRFQCVRIENIQEDK